MRNLPTLGLAFLGLAFLEASTASAQNYDAMAKWTEAKVVHMHVSGDYGGDFVVSGRTARMTDHVEFDFDWDNLENKLIGKPTIKNVPSKLGPLTLAVKDHPLWASCPEPRIETAPEHWTLQSVASANGRLELQAKQESFAGSYPNPAPGLNSKCGDSWTKVTVESKTISAGLIVPAPMLLEMGMGGSGIEITKDKKSFILTDTAQPGWVWTMTPTIVK